jgi:hypothetical protein
MPFDEEQIKRKIFPILRFTNRIRFLDSKVLLLSITRIHIAACDINIYDRLCGLVVRVPGYRSRGLGSFPCATRFFEK